MENQSRSNLTKLALESYRLLKNNRCYALDAEATNEPWSRKSWSGPFWVGRQVVLRSQVWQTPVPPPGFWQAAPALDITDLLFQNH
jgi:hypothetical protein